MSQLVAEKMQMQIVIICFLFLRQPTKLMDKIIVFVDRKLVAHLHVCSSLSDHPL